jgi:hypothetical protein
MWGSLADGVLAVTPEAWLRDRKNADLMHSHGQLPDCDFALRGLVRFALCTPKSPFSGTCAITRIVDGSTDCASKPLSGLLRRWSRGLLNEQLLLTTLIRRRCQRKEFCQCSGKCRLHCHHDLRMYKIQFRAILKGSL